MGFLKDVSSNLSLCLFKTSRFSLSNHDRLLLTFELRVAEDALRYKTVQQQHVLFFGINSGRLAQVGAGGHSNYSDNLCGFSNRTTTLLHAAAGKHYDLLLAVMQQQLDGPGKGD